jgi:CDP-paratose 2-epimerase
MKTALVTGSGGLIGSQSVNFLIEKGFQVIGIDNDMRSYFFGSESSTFSTTLHLSNKHREKFLSYFIDIRTLDELERIFLKHKFDIVIHTAAQPSHDWAAKEPLTDFTVNALGTMNLLEMTRKYSPEASFIFTSTNKVYGDRPNLSYYSGSPDVDYSMGLRIIEEEKRYEGRWRITGELACIDENMSIDQNTHSVFGASKVAADVMVQEYGRYFGMNTVVFRGGCLTGPDHAGAELHGFLSYLIKCMVNSKPYTIFGYKGKQVRDNIHSYDLVNMFWEYHRNPRPGEVYNAGGGRENSTSILEAIDSVNKILSSKGISEWKNFQIEETPRIGDHVWYISDLQKFRDHYPDWKITLPLDSIIEEITNKEIEKCTVLQK